MVNSEMSSTVFMMRSTYCAELSNSRSQKNICVHMRTHATDAKMRSQYMLPSYQNLVKTVIRAKKLHSKAKTSTRFVLWRM